MDTQPRRLEYLPLDALKVAKWNPKDHDAHAITASVAEHGYVDPIIMDDRTERIVAGHGRRDELLRARAAGEPPPDGVVVDDDGVWTVPVVRGWRSRSDAQADRYVVADNRVGEAGGWKPDELAGRLEKWREQNKLEGTGWTPRAADEFLAGHKPPPPPEPDPEVPDEPDEPVSRPGDVWLLGDGHRLMCGDSTSPDDMATLMAGAQADLVFTSPPYNVDVQYQDHDDESMPWPQYRAFLEAVVRCCTTVLAPGRFLAWNIGVSPRTYPHRQVCMLEDAGLTVFRQLVWRKVGVPVPSWHFTLDNPVVRQLTPNYQHELVVLVTKGQLERGGPAVVDGVLEHDVFTVNQTAATRSMPDSPTSPRSGAKSNLDRRANKEHPAMFPIQLPLSFIGHLADKGAVVLEPFAGSGTTLLAAARLGRLGYGMEKGPGYCDVACRRWQAATGQVPVLESTGVAHDFTT